MFYNDNEVTQRFTLRPVFAFIIKILLQKQCLLRNYLHHHQVRLLGLFNQRVLIILLVQGDPRYN